MSFELENYRLVWKTGRYKGLEVVARGMTIEELQTIASLSEVVATKDNTNEKLAPIFALLEDGIEEWNYTKKGVPVAVTNLGKLDAGMLMAIVKAWSNVLAVSDPLDEDSPNGKPLETALIPMEIPSSSHSNLNTQN